MKILIVEDEYALMKTVEEFLSSEKYLVEKASDFRSAMEKVMIYDYDCILLDISLPGGSGLQILDAMKSEGKAGNVIIISAKNSIEDKIAGLDLGADDYLTKPYSESYCRFVRVFQETTILRATCRVWRQHFQAEFVPSQYLPNSATAATNTICATLSRRETPIEKPKTRRCKWQPKHDKSVNPVKPVFYLSKVLFRTIL